MPCIKTDQAIVSKDRPPPLKGVRRALQVLEYIATHPGRATDIAEGLDISWATLHRTLQQLEQGGFLKRESPGNRYRIGPRMYFIGSTYIADHRVVELAKPYLEEPLGLPGIMIQLVERSGNESVVVHFSTHSEEEITKATYGYHFPLHAGSKGQVLLAHADQAFIEEYLSHELERLTQFTVTDPEQIREILKKTREQGYSITIADIQTFTGSMAAPVFDSNNEIVAAVCFVARKSTMENAKKRERLLESLLKIANSISIALGWRPGGR